MTSKELKDILESAINEGIITCREINSLRCPAVGYPLVHGWCCNKPKCHWGDRYACVHRLDIGYTDNSDPDILKVRYRIYPGVRDGFIDSGDGRLGVVLDKIASRRR